MPDFTTPPADNGGQPASGTAAPAGFWTRRRLLISIATIVLALIVVYGGVSWVFSSKLIATQFSADETITFSDFGLPQPEDLTFSNGDTNLSGWFFANPAHAGCAVLVMHGYSGNKAELLSTSPLFWDRGCDLMFYDARGHGQSSRGLHTYGALEKDDELKAVDWLANRTGLPDAKIGVIGWSYGAATALLAAADRQDLAFVVADCSYSSLEDIANAQAKLQFGSWAKIFVPGALLVSGWRADFDPSDASPKTAVQGLKTPTLLVHSTEDNFTPSVQSEKIYANSDPSHTTLVLTTWGAAHGMSYSTDRVAYTKILDDFLAKFAPGFGAPRTQT